EELAVLGQHAVHLRLLQHDLGHEDAVRLARAPPGEVAAVSRVPGEQPALERADRSRLGQAHRAESTTGPSGRMTTCRSDFPCTISTSPLARPSRSGADGSTRSRTATPPPSTPPCGKAPG